MPNPSYTKYVKRGSISERSAIRDMLADAPGKIKKADRDTLKCIMAAERLLWLLGCNPKSAIKVIKIVANDPNFPGKLD